MISDNHRLFYVLVKAGINLDVVKDYLDQAPAEFTRSEDVVQYALGRVRRGVPLRLVSSLPLSEHHHEYEGFIYLRGRVDIDCAFLTYLRQICSLVCPVNGHEALFTRRSFRLFQAEVICWNNEPAPESDIDVELATSGSEFSSESTENESP